MSHIFKPNNFELYEWLPDYFYNLYYSTYKENLWWMLLSFKIRYTADRLRKRYGPMIMNDWKWRGINGNRFRGYRPLDCNQGARLSQHKLGNALDAKFKYVSIDQIRADILSDPFHEDFKYITCIEIGVPWLHVDCRNRDKQLEGILKIKT